MLTLRRLSDILNKENIEGGNRMTRFLAIMRRFFLAGFVALLICVIFLHRGISSLWSLIQSANLFAGIFSGFILFSPLVYILFLVLSCIYIRKHGQFAAVHSSQPFIVTVGKAFCSDLASPFKNIATTFSLFVKKQPDYLSDDAIRKSKSVRIRRLVIMLVLFIFCVVGLCLIAKAPV